MMPAPRSRPVLARVLVALLACGVAGVYAGLVPLGLPYDEPSHWGTVVAFHRYRGLPVLGDPGTSYEAQQAPVFYALLSPLAGLPLPVPALVLAARAATVAMHGLLAERTLVLVHSVLTGPRRLLAASSGALVVGINPMFAAMGGSVQNDTLSLALLVAAWALIAARCGQAVLGWGTALGAGVLLGAAMMTKISAVPAVAVTLLWLAWRWRRAWWRPLATGVVAAAASVWWVLRNLRLYGDLTGQAGVARTGASFPHAEFGAVQLARQVASGLTSPTEYLRNVVSLPTSLDLVCVAVTGLLLLAALASLTELRRPSSVPALLLVAGAVSVLAWLAEVLADQPVAFRTAQACLPALAFAIARAAVRVRWGWPAIGLVLAGMVATNVWLWVSLASHPPAAMLG